jgi:radical SAM-linked protein
LSDARQRWRLVFRRDEAAMYLSHLDAIHSWERAMRRGDIPLAMSEGFNPRPKLAFAAPLQLGMLAEHELADLILTERLTAPDLRRRLAACLPRGYRVTDLFDVWTGEASIAPQLAAADYRMTLLGVGREEVAAAIGRILGAATLPRERRREARTIKYDLRPLVIDLKPQDAGSAPPLGESRSAASGGSVLSAGLWMRLRHSQDGGTGRAEEVVAAIAEDLGLRTGWTEGEEEEPKAEPDSERSGSPDPDADRPAPASPGSGQRLVEVVMPVRERLWLAGELA